MLNLKTNLTLTLSICLYAALYNLGCDDEAESRDCTRVSGACAVGFLCVQDDQGRYACVDEATASGDEMTAGETGGGSMSGGAISGGSLSGGNMVGGDAAGAEVLVEEYPVYATLDCAAQIVQSIEPSNEVGTATNISLGSVYSARIDPESTQNQVHFWRVTLEPGYYHLVVENRRADDRSSNKKITLTWVDQSGTEINPIFETNSTTPNTRKSLFMEVIATETRFIEVTSNFVAQDYELLVIPNGEPVSGPYFNADDCPEEVVSLALDSEYEFSLSEQRDEYWFKIDQLEIGDYSFQMTGRRAGSGAIAFSAYTYDRFRETGRQTKVVDEYVTRTEFVEASGVFNVGEQSHFWVQVVKDDTNGPSTLTLRVNRQ